MAVSAVPMIDVRRADLHMHTCHSDGQLSPAELVMKAHDYGLRAIAITDHDCVDGLGEGAQAGRQYGIEVIAGVELSVSVGHARVHLLGYFFDPEHPGLSDHLAALKDLRRRRMLLIQERLAHLDVPVAIDLSADRAYTRPHVAEAMVEAGHVGSRREAFAQYLGDDKPAYVPEPRLAAVDALDALHDAGGIGVLAHPGHYVAAETVSMLLSIGLDGLETIHRSHDDVLTAYYRQLARDMGLVETGGSDFHRPDADEPLGRWSVPYAWLDTARSRSEGHKRTPIRW